MINRALSKPLTALLLKTPLTPNQVTLISLGFGILSGVFFAKGDTSFTLLAALFFQIAAVLDNCDGNIARAKDLKSEFGGWFDVVADVLVDLALFSGLTVGLLRQGAKEPVVALGVLCVTGSLINFMIVCLEKKKGFGPAVFDRPHPEGSGRENILHRITEGIREGDSSWFVMIFALFLKTDWLLSLSAVYVQILWISAIVMNFKWLFTPLFLKTPKRVKKERGSRN